MTRPPDLQALRDAIEAVDEELLSALKKRMHLVDRVAAAKLDAASPFRDQQREELVLRRVRHLAVAKGLDSHEVERLYRWIMQMSIARQQEHIRTLPTAPMRVAYQGADGSFSHLAAQQLYAGREGGVLLSGYQTFRAAAEAVVDGEADLALLPIENTTAGSINETYDLLTDGRVVIIGELVTEVEHCLLALPGAGLEELRTVLSHPQGLLQCEAFLARRPWLQPRAEFDTAGAARKVKESGDPTLGAIASESAARVYGLEVLESSIQDEAGNFTRFVEIAREPVPCPPETSCKTSLMLSVAHEPGALSQVLQRLSKRGISLTKLESRPLRGSPFRYRFYLDIEGHAASRQVEEALEEIRPLTGELRILGTYPASRDTTRPDAGVGLPGPPLR